MKLSKNEVKTVLLKVLPEYIDVYHLWSIEELLDIAARRLFIKNDRSGDSEVIRTALKQLDSGERFV